MQVLVFDTHVNTEKGDYYHFDVLVNEANIDKVKDYVAGYLARIGVQAKEVKTSRCAFCHTESGNQTVQAAIAAHGHFILPMEGCPKPQPV